MEQHTAPWTQVTRYGTNHVAAEGFEPLDGSPNRLRLDVYVNSRTGERFTEGRHTARAGGPDYSPLHTHYGSGSCGCGWGYLNASHTQAAHDESIANQGK